MSARMLDDSSRSFRELRGAAAGRFARRLRLGAVPAMLLCASVSSACRHAPREDATAATAPAAAPIDHRARISLHFQLAEFIKPDEASTGREDALLAPLIVLQVQPGGGPSPLRPLPHRESTVDAGQAGGAAPGCVYFEDGVATLHGRAFRQRTCAWRIAAAGSGDEKGETAWIGYRMTIGDDGLPFAWEWFDDREVASLVYVSRRLENAAAASFGGPLAGRQFSIERSVEEQPGVLVPRILDESPEPLGPFVYLDERGRLTTLICRCMASQVSEFSESLYYELRPWAGASAAGPDETAGQDGVSGGMPPHRRGSAARPDRLQQVLRLPESW